MPIYAVTERPAPLRADLPPPPSRRTVAGAVAIGLVLAAVVGVVETRRTNVPLPPATATAEEVVRTYLAAVDAGDAATAKALVAPDHLQVTAYEDTWYDDVISIRDLRVEPAVAETPPGHRPEQVWVRVYFDLRERPRFWRTKDDEPWGYQLARGGPGERWLITGEGKV